MAWILGDKIYITQDDILQGPRRDDPIVANCIGLWERGQLSWEQAMMLAVMMLSKEVDSLRKRVIEQLHAEPFLPDRIQIG